MKKFNLALAGGTFDHFHKGHREFLRFIFSQSKRLVLGITSDNYVENSKVSNSSSEPYKIRKGAVENFLRQENAFARTKITPINSLHIPKVWENLPIEAIFASKDTIKGAEAINKLRRQEGLLPIEIVLFPLTKGDDGQSISSSLIRKGKINREGKLYINPICLRKTLVITDSLRQELRKPFGLLIKDFKSWMGKNQRLPVSSLVTVGDVVTKACNDFSIKNKISIIDFQVGRKKMFSQITDLRFTGKETIISAGNPRGCVTAELFRSIIKVFTLSQSDKRTIILVDGEEDLAVIPVLLAAPLGLTILYGQPEKGVVAVDVTEVNKQKAYDIIGRFTTQ